MFYWICFIVSIIQLCKCEPISFDECASSKTCFRHFECTQTKCDYFASWKIVKDKTNADILEVELMGTLDDSVKGHVALGFSEDNKMTNDGVIGCYLFEAKLSSAIGYNPGLSNTFLSTPNVLVENPTVNFVNFDANSKMLSCRTQRVLKPSTNVEELKDLTQKKYYIMGSVGSMRKTTGFSKHYSGRDYVTKQEFDVTKWNSIDQIGDTSLKVDLVKLHAIFMVIGWMFLLTNGILIAAVFRRNWLKSSRSVALWFRLHQGFQYVGMIFVLVAFLLIFFHTNWKYSTTLAPNISGIINSLHPILGIISTVLLVFNPLNALFRCKAGHPKRQIFNWIHYLSGVVSYIMAMVNLIIGMQVLDKWSKAQYPWILSLIAFILSIVGYIFGKWWIKKKMTINASIDNENGSHIENNTKLSKPVPDYLFWIYLSVTGAFTIVLVVVISII